MYSWSQYLSAMNKINKSKANPRSPKAWTKFSILNLPADTYRKGQIIRAVLGRQRSRFKNINKHLNAKFEDFDGQFKPILTFYLRSKRQEQEMEILCRPFQKHPHIRQSLDYLPCTKLSLL